MSHLQNAMTVGEILGDEAVAGDDVLGEILGDLIGDAKGQPPGKTPAAPGETPKWQKYVDLATQFVPATVTAIADAAKPGSAAKEPSGDPGAGKEPPSKPKSFFAQDVGPLPVWGWGAVVAAAGGGLWYWVKRRRAF